MLRMRTRPWATTSKAKALSNYSAQPCFADSFELTYIKVHGYMVTIAISFFKLPASPGGIDTGWPLTHGRSGQVNISQLEYLLHLSGCGNESYPEADSRVGAVASIIILRGGTNEKNIGRSGNGRIFYRNVRRD